MDFVRDENDSRRVVIIDVSHLFYKFAFGGAKGLSSTIMVDGVPKQVDTTLPTYTIKYIHRVSNYGYNPTVVCFDGAGCTKSRKAYFKKHILTDGSNVDYKGDRNFQDNRFYEGVNITMNLLLQGGVCCLKADGYEADDLIFAAVQKAKIDYPHLPIDIITGDQDLIPLVDDQVSVFIYSRKSTWAESKDIEKNHYFQITPHNYSEYVEGLTEFSKLSVPYNTVLLKKLLRGKKADSVPGYPKFTPTKYNKLISNLIEDGYDLSDLCRYDAPIAQICYGVTREPIPEELIDSVPREQKMIIFKEPPALTKLCNVLSDYLDDDVIRHIRTIYNGVNLNCAYADLPEPFNRRPANLTVPLNSYDEGLLQQAVSVVQIRLPFRR